MTVIIQLQYSLADSRVFHDVKNITQSSLHPTQPNPTRGWTQPMTNSGLFWTDISATVQPIGLNFCTMLWTMSWQCFATFGGDIFRGLQMRGLVVKKKGARVDHFWPLRYRFLLIWQRISRKWYKIELYLQWQTDRKSYTTYRMVLFSMTLNDT